MQISSYPENELIKIASGFKKHLKESFPTIQGAYSGLDEGFIYRFKALFYDVQSSARELMADHQISHLNHDLHELAVQVREKLFVFRFYLQKAFPYNHDLCEAFSTLNIERAIKDFNLLNNLLIHTLSFVEEKRPILLNAGYGEINLEELVHSAQKINSLHDELTQHKQKRSAKERTYHFKLKELYRMMEIVHEAASRSLKNNPDSLRHLTFPPHGMIQ